MKNIQSIILVLVACGLSISTLQAQTKYWIEEDGNLFYNDGNVGIGTHTPNHKLEVVGDVKVNKLISNTVEFTGDVITIKKENASNPLLKGQYTTEGKAQVAINTDKFANGAALTVQGVAYFSKDDGSAPINVLADQLQNYNVWAEGGVVTTKIAVKETSGWADYVFANEYDLPALEDVEAYLKEHKHLIGMPSQAEIEEKGYYSVHTLNMKLLENIEKLTLYTIEQDKQLKKAMELLEQYEKEVKK